MKIQFREKYQKGTCSQSERNRFYETTAVISTRFTLIKKKSYKNIFILILLVLILDIYHWREWASSCSLQGQYNNKSKGGRNHPIYLLVFSFSVLRPLKLQSLQLLHNATHQPAQSEDTACLSQCLRWTLRFLEFYSEHAWKCLIFHSFIHYPFR